MSPTWGAPTRRGHVTREGGGAARLGMWRWSAFSLLGLFGGVVLNIAAMSTLGGVPPTLGDLLMGALFGLPVGLLQSLAAGRRQLGFGWVVACTAGFTAMVGVVLGPLETAHAGSPVRQAVVHGVAAGLCLGAAQFLYLRRRTPVAAMWLPATVAVALVAEFTGRAVGLIAPAPLNLLALFWTWQILAGLTLKRVLQRSPAPHLTAIGDRGPAGHRR